MLRRGYRHDAAGIRGVADSGWSRSDKPESATRERTGSARMTVLVGTSGWSYPEWRGTHYPAGLPQRQQLPHLAGRLRTVELNASFYAAQRLTSYLSWHDRTPHDFVFAVKGPRLITHLRRLREPAEPLARFLGSGVLALGNKLGPILWQLPPALPFDPTLVANFLDLPPEDTEAALNLALRHGVPIPSDQLASWQGWRRPLRHAVEPRHSSFRSDVFGTMLRERGIALVVSDSPGTWPCLEQHTADFGYLRLHGDAELYVSAYSDTALARWSAKIRALAAGGRDAYVYFDNTAEAAAPRDAERLSELLTREPVWDRRSRGKPAW